MKICITAVGPELSSATDPRFGRCAYFLIIDEQGKLLKAIPNKGVQAMRGAGVTAAQIVADQGVKIVVTGNVGPNAYMVLTQSGTKIFPGVFNMTAKQAFELYKQGKLKEIDPSQAREFGPGFGQRLGRGIGQGRGRGRNR